jgi:hypothetical protein
MTTDEVREEIRRMNQRYPLVVGEPILIRYRSTKAACRLHVYEIIYKMNKKTLLHFK